MDTVPMIKYAMVIQRISELQVSFDPPDGRVIVRYTNRAGPQRVEITFAELSALLTRSNPGPPGGPPA